MGHTVVFMHAASGRIFKQLRAPGSEGGSGEQEAEEGPEGWPAGQRVEPSPWGGMSSPSQAPLNLNATAAQPGFADRFMSSSNRLYADQSSGQFVDEGDVHKLEQAQKALDAYLKGLLAFKQVVEDATRLSDVVNRAIKARSRASDPALWKDLDDVMGTCRGHIDSKDLAMLHEGRDWPTFAEAVESNLGVVEEVLHRAGGRLYGAPHRDEDSSVRPEFSSRRDLQALRRRLQAGTRCHTEQHRGELDRVGRTRSSANVGQRVKEVVDRSPAPFVALSSRDLTIPRQTSGIAERSTKSRP